MEEPEDGEESCEMMWTRHNMVVVLKNSPAIITCTDLHNIKPFKNVRIGGGGANKSPDLPEDPLAVDGYWERESSFYFRLSSLVCHPCSYG